MFIVHSVRREDAGVYTCLAQNPAGQAEVNTMVTVKGQYILLFTLYYFVVTSKQNNQW